MKTLRSLATQIVALQHKARALGLFADDRDLLECPACGLLENVAAGGGLFTCRLLPHVQYYADRRQEHFICPSMNGANEILNIRIISIGLIDRSPVHPREVFADAVADRASGIIVAHNHPSGGLEPSSNDIAITGQLKAAGAMSA